MKKFFLVSVSMMLLALTSCTITGPEVEKWERMSFVSEETTIDNSGNISIPAEGGTYHIKCINYEQIDFNYNSLIEDDIEMDTEKSLPKYELNGNWTKVMLKGNVLTVTIKPNDSGKERRTVLLTYFLGATGSLTFNQAAE
ncbi:hypothetical protein HMPREF9140_01723 [Prevotella micans F0438]|uniref:Lipocalin-like domain-containing protein n=1 Tax=Prevotella micans F0438 TaxID=883158 RepID=H1Q485_9BACT|nr:hypothetical protein [Prevotella micans]EHO67866.1 hypothetical protein HMPREF9140_01723 [Prevotella micans F0438]